MFDVGTARTDLITTGGQDFDIDFVIYNKHDVAVYLDRVLKLVDIEYTVRTLGGGAPFETIALNDLPALATIRFPIAPTTSLNLSILSTRAIEHPTTYPTAPISPRRVERDLDSLAMICRMIDERIGRALKFNPWSLQREVLVPEPEEGKVLGWISSLLTNVPSGKGDKGDTGSAPVFRVAVGVPSNSLGINGDVYLDSATANVYLKGAGVYTLVANIKGVAGAGAAPTVREVDGTPTISVVAVIEFDSTTGLAVVAPGAGAARIGLVQSTVGAALRVAADEAAARAAILAPGLASDNVYTGRQQGSKGTNIVSATAITPAANGNYFHITGTTSIETIAALAAGTRLTLVFDGIVTLVHSANLILIAGVNFTTAAGVICEFQSEGAGVWREVNRHTTSVQSVAGITDFIASGTWTRGTVTKVLITAVGGGAGGGVSNFSDGGGGGGAGEIIYRALVDVSSDLVITIPAAAAHDADGGTVTVVGTGVSMSALGGKHGLGGGGGGAPNGGNGGGLKGGVTAYDGSTLSTLNGLPGDTETVISEGGASGGQGGTFFGAGDGGPSVIFLGGAKGAGTFAGGGGGGSTIFARGGAGAATGAVGSNGAKGSGGGGGGAGVHNGGSGGAGFVRIEIVA